MRMVSDDYGRKRTLPLLPLSFDRVNGGRFPLSGSPLFKLPFEVLGQILQHVVPTSLPSLALVNHDCRQLARSRQFASVHLDTSDSCLELMELLRAEDGERKANSTTSLPALGVCVRRVRVTEGRMWQDRFQIDYADESWEKLDRETQIQRVKEAYKFYDWTFLPAVQYIISSRRILPHLEELDLECRGPFPQAVFNSLTQSSIQHLKLRKFYVYEDYSIVPSSLLRKTWPLRTLHLEFMIDYRDPDVTTVPLATSILGLCAPTLESLTWIDRCRHRKKENSFVTAFLDSAPCFTHLRNVILEHISFKDSSMLDAFLQNSPCTLSISTGSSPEYAKFLQERGSIPSLKAFDLMAWPEHNGALLCFLKTNTHLSMLSLPNPISAPFLETRLLPLLSNSFWKLTSLSLSWDASSISERALEMISSLNSLQQIHLSAGNPGIRFKFEIDHKAMRKHLQKLKVLRKLAFSRDTYSHRLEGYSLGYYYALKLFAEEEPTGQEARDRIWEKMHQTRMMTEADQYGHIMPQLEWIFVGQIQLGFKELSSTEGPPGTKRTSVPLATERDTTWRFLSGMFGVGEDR